MNTNTNYGRLVDGRIEYAPAALATEGNLVVNPTEAAYLAAGWKPVVDVPPEAPAGKAARVSGWREDGGRIVRVYKLVDAPAEAAPASPTATPGHRVFSKLKLVAALKEADKWVLVKTWLEERAYYDFYLAAQDFAEDHPLFVEGRAAIQSYLHAGDDDIERILAKCVAD